MKGFKNSTRTRSGFSFGSNQGYSASTGKVQNISYTRKTPHRKPVMKADGGEVRKTTGAQTTPAEKKAAAPVGILDRLRRLTGAQSTKNESERTKTIDKQVDSMDHKRGGKIMKKAEGGRVVDSALQGRVPPSSALDAESGGTSPLRPGFMKGGKPCYAKGGRVPEHRIAAVEAKRALAAKGHKGMKGC